MTASKQIGDVVLAVENISLSFGGVRALSDISFAVREYQVLSIIGPNGAGKSSLLNVINGFYHPQEGLITYRAVTRKQMRPHEAARQGIARTFQNIALFKGMSTLDNIMTGRNTLMRKGIIWQALRLGPALKEELVHRERVEQIIDFLEIEHIRKDPGWQAAVRIAETCRTRARTGGGAIPAAARRADGRDECRGEAGHEPLHSRRQWRVRDHYRADRA